MIVLRQADVFARNRLAGCIQETDECFCFAYNPVYLASENPGAVSLTLPLQTEPYTSHTLFPFFDGLIPEGWPLSIACRNWKIDQANRFGLLMVACRDCIGNVSIQEVDV
ncbi:MAG: HipA N-terminal domain-containing protein [Clostridia bacterium]|nr:HipA N-terminal domain-containing protein [Clostridia bacterium]